MRPKARAAAAGEWLLIAAPFAVGAVAGAALLAGVAGVGPSGSTGPSASTQSVATVATDVARTSAQFDAQTIYERDSPGVVDITVTEAATQGNGQGLSPFVPGGGSSQQAQAEGTGYVIDKER